MSFTILQAGTSSVEPRARSQSEHSLSVPEYDVEEEADDGKGDANGSQCVVDHDQRSKDGDDLSHREAVRGNTIYTGSGRHQVEVAT